MADFVKRYWFFFTIVILPLAVLGVVRSVPLQVLPSGLVAELKPACFLRGFEEYEADGKLKDAAKPKPECVGAAPPPAKQKAATDQAKAEQAKAEQAKSEQAKSGQGQPKQKSEGADASNAEGPKKSAEEPKKKSADVRTLVQFRAAEVNTRADFGIASGVMQAVALGGLVFALVQLIASWSALQLPARPSLAAAKPAIRSDRALLIVFAVLAVVCAVVMVYCDTASRSFDNVLMNEQFNTSAGLFGATMEAQKGASEAFAAFRKVIFLNLLMSYTAAALLLVYLAVLTIPAAPLGNAAQRLGGLQFIVLIGAALFALSAVANNAAIAWATIGLDADRGAALIEATGSIPKLWSLASSGFLITAIVVGYAGIRANAPPAASENAAGKEPASEKATNKDSALALRTPSGDDFKAFGWVVQFVVALAPIWAPAGLAKIFDLLKAIP